MPEGRTQCGDERTRGRNAPPIHVSTTCADSSGCQSHIMTRTRHPQMTVRFENCLGSITHQGETDGFLTNPPNDRGGHPILQFQNKTC